MAHVRRRHLLGLLPAAALVLLSALPSAAHGPSCPFSSPADHDHHDHHHHHHHHVGHHHHDDCEVRVAKLPEELAEEEDLALFGLDDEEDHHHHHHHHDHHFHGDQDPEASKIGLWAQAMGCSLLVSMASLVCLIIVPVFFLQGRPSKAVVDSLAAFGAGAMLGDAFLHQLPHAFGGEHSHSHDHHIDNLHEHLAEHGHSHSHSLEDLSVGLSVLFGIVLFLLVEKVVRYVEDFSGKGAHALVHGHHHHKRHHKLKDDDDDGDNSDMKNDDSIGKDAENHVSKEKSLDGESNNRLNDGKHTEQETLRKRVTSNGTSAADGKDPSVENGPVAKNPLSEMASSPIPSSLVFGYLNLFSDGVHNFTDGMALGSAFLLYGSVGGWSRTLFLLAHELPQEVGDFGILVRSGFTVSKALFFNFLSALVALAGTALALVLGKDPGHSSLIEGFTAGGFIYIAVAGVLPEMNNGSTTFKSTALQVTSLILGMAVALCISLVE